MFEHIMIIMTPHTFLLFFFFFQFSFKVLFVFTYFRSFVCVCVPINFIIIMQQIENKIKTLFLFSFSCMFFSMHYIMEKNIRNYDYSLQNARPLFATIYILFLILCAIIICVCVCVHILFINYSHLLSNCSSLCIAVVLVSFPIVFSSKLLYK